MIFSLNMRAFVPHMVLTTFMVCLTSPPLLPGTVVPLGGNISICMYFGTAAWNTSDVMSVFVELVNIAVQEAF